MFWVFINLFLDFFYQVKLFKCGDSCWEKGSNLYFSYSFNEKFLNIFNGKCTGDLRKKKWGSKENIISPGEKRNDFQQCALQHPWKSISSSQSRESEGYWNTSSWNVGTHFNKNCDHMMNKLSFSTAGKKISRYSRENQANICEVCKWIITKHLLESTGKCFYIQC